MGEPLNKPVPSSDGATVLPRIPAKATTEAPAMPGPGAAQLGRAVVLGIGAIILVFGTYEVVERTALQGVAMARLHVFHMARGVLASVLAASAVGWALLRSSPPLLARESSEAPAERSSGEAAPQAAHFARWFIQMRWVVVVVAAALVVVAVQFARLLPPEVWWPLIATTGLLAATNAAYSQLIRLHGWAERTLRLQVYVDLVVLTLLLHFSGGIENPLTFLALFHVVIAGILLDRRQCYAVAAAGSALIALMTIAEWMHVIDHYTLTLFPHGVHGDHHAAHQGPYVASRIALHPLILFLIAYFVSTLAERARANENRVAAMADRALAERQLLVQALETTRTGLRVVGSAGSTEWMNRRWQEWFGRKDLGADANAGAVSTALGEGHLQVTEERVEEEGTGARVYQLTTAPLVDQAGSVRRAAQLAQDVTQQKLAQSQMVRAGRLAAVGELAGQVAHEVNNPISIVSAKARLMLSRHREEMSPGVASELEKIVRLSDRIASITQGLLSYCRPSPSSRAVLDVRTPIRDALQLVEQRARGAEVAIDDRLGSTELRVEANAGEIEQVFLNLFLNALDVMPDGGTLTVSLESNGANPPRAVARVQDTGPGIPEDVRERIWEPFFSTKGDKRGTGLGLSICQGLVHSHGGTIAAGGDPGGGACFTVGLPIAAEEPQEHRTR